MRVLVTGATGFVGRHVARRLADLGHDVAAMTRDPATYHGPGAAVRGDIADPPRLRHALEGCAVAYYLVHSLSADDFANRDRRGAEAFAAAAVAAGVEQVIYLGGLGDERDDLSPHLRSRREVERVLTATAPTTSLRAAIVVGDGGISWEILRQLVERLPVMLTPRWVQTRTQPIALTDALTCLVGVMGRSETIGASFDIGGPESMTYRDMLTTVARITGRRRLIVPVPVLSPRLSSHWLNLITDVDMTTARALVDSLTNEVVVHDRRIDAIVGTPEAPYRPLAFAAAVSAALTARERRLLSDTPHAVA